MKKRYLVIGGSSGIGKSIIEKLLDKGYEVVNISRSKPDIEGIEHHSFDILSDTIALDDQPIDGLIYCPGSINLKPFHRLKIEEFQNDLEVNYLGAVKAVQALLPNLKKSESASIVLISTVAVQTGMAFHSSIAGAKGAVEGLTRALAAELAPKIRVNAIAPSIIDTPLASKLLSTDEKMQQLGARHPLQRVGEARDISSLATFLLTEDSSWITGQIISVDGGMGSIK